MNIYGDKIFLRAIEKEDCELLLELINDPEIEIMLGGNSWPVSHDAQIKWQERQIDNKSILRCIMSWRWLQKNIYAHYRKDGIAL